MLRFRCDCSGLPWYERSGHQSRIREEVTANTCFGTKARVHQHVGQFFRDIAQRTDGVKRQGRRALQAQADALTPIVDAILLQPNQVDPTVDLV